MKKSILILLLLSVLKTEAQTIPNAGFETWISNTESTQSYLVPQSWISKDVAACSTNPSYSVAAVTRTIDSHSGQYAALFQTAVAGNDTINGALYSCNSLVNIVGNTGYIHFPITGFPISTRPAMFQGYCKLTSINNDVALFHLCFTKWNTSLNKRDTVTQIYSTITTSQPSSAYFQFSVPISYNLAEYPDTVSITAAIAPVILAGVTHMGTQLFLDDLTFSGAVPLGIKSIDGTHLTATVYPNPTTNSFIFESSNTDKQNLQLFDVTGKLVLMHFVEGKTTIDVSDLNEGVYNISIIGNDGVINSKLVILR